MKSFKKIIKAMKTAGISWITVWLIVVAVVFFAVVGFAAYTRVNIVKRVVSTKAGAGFLFSSNYMATGSLSTIEYDDYEAYTGDNNPIYTATVCNYAQGDMSSWYSSSNIEYKMTAKIFLNERYTASEATELGNSSLEGQYKTPDADDLRDKVFGIRYGSSGTFSYFSAEQTTIQLPEIGYYSLSKESVSADMFDVVFDKSELLGNAPGFWIQLTAKPKDVVGGEITEISGYLGICKRASGEAGWTGYIGDADYNTLDYDAYNYIVTGNGKGTFYFAWDDDKVRPNEFSFANYGSGSELSPSSLTNFSGYTQYGTTAPTSGNWKYVSFPVDSDVLPRYEFQLYKTGGTNYGNAIITYVDYKFTANSN